MDLVAPGAADDVADVAPGADEVGRRERKKVATRGALQSAAFGLFAEHGYDAVTIEQITDAADVSRRTFFRYFAGKEDLLFGQQPRHVDLIRDALEAHPGGLPVLECIREVCAQVRAADTEDPTVHRLRLSLIRETPHLPPAASDAMHVWETSLIVAVARWTGLPRDARYVLVTATCATAAIRAGLMRWFDLGPGADIQAEVDGALAMLGTGLAAVTGSGPSV